MENLNELDTHCWVCHKPEEYNVCVDCGVDIFIEGFGGNILGYLEKFKPERFNEIMDLHKKK